MRKTTIITIILLILFIIFNVYLHYQLDTTRNLLRITVDQLTTTQSQLDIMKTELTNTKTQLVGTKLQLGYTQDRLTDTESELQTTAMQLSTTKNQLENIESQLRNAKSQLETAKNEQLKMRNQYSDLKEQINLRLGQMHDCQKFITPDNPIVSAKAKEITGGYSQDVNERWRDYKRLYSWVVNNVEYSNDSYSPILPTMLGGELAWAKECWRMPAETLEDEVGDCEDMAVLLASLMLSYNKQEFGVWAIGIKNEDSAHLAIAFPVVGNNLAILDPAGNYYTGFQAGRLQSYDVSKAVNDWASRLAKTIPKAEVYLAFSNKFYHEFSSTDEFINWVKD